MDPETGALLDVNEQQSTTLRTSATAAPSLVGFDADLIATPASVTQIVALDNKGRSELNLLQTVLPLVFGIVGAVALVAGIFLSRRRNAVAAGPDSDVDASQEVAPADSEPPAVAARGRHAATAGLVPGLDDEPTQATRATETTAGEGPDSTGS